MMDQEELQKKYDDLVKAFHENSFQWGESCAKLKKENRRLSKSHDELLFERDALLKKLHESESVEIPLIKKSSDALRTSAEKGIVKLFFLRDTLNGIERPKTVEEKEFIDIIDAMEEAIKLDISKRVDNAFDLFEMTDEGFLDQGGTINIYPK